MLINYNGDANQVLVYKYNQTIHQFLDQNRTQNYKIKNKLHVILHKYIRTQVHYLHIQLICTLIYNINMKNNGKNK